MSNHWTDRLFEAQQDSDYANWPHGDNVHVRRLADAQRCLREICFADAAIDAERQALLVKAKSIRATLAETQVSMVVAGSWNAGKSTLINAFLGERWMPMNANRETVTVNRLLDGERRQLRVFFRDGRPSGQLRDEYQNAQDVHQKIQDLGRGEREAIERIDILYPGHPFLKWCAIIDTPGLDFSKEDSIVSQPLIDEADVLVWVMHIEGPREQDHQALRIFRQRNPGSRVLAVVNYADMLDDSEYEDAFADKQERLKQDADAVFFVSAKRDLEQRDNDPGFKQLRAYLNEQILPAYGDLRHRRPTRLASEMVARICTFAERIRSQPIKPLSERIMDLQPELERLTHAFKTKTKDRKIQPGDSSLNVSRKLRDSFVAVLNHARALLALDASQFDHSVESEESQALAELSVEIAQGRVKLGIFGNLSAGKSTFINTLMKSSNMLPVDEDRCTSVFTRVRQADADHPAQTLEIDWKPLNKLMEDLGQNLMTLGIQLPSTLNGYLNSATNQTISSGHLAVINDLLEQANRIRKRELKDEISRSAHEQSLALLRGLCQLEKLRAEHRSTNIRGGRVEQDVKDFFWRRAVRSEVDQNSRKSNPPPTRYDSEHYRRLMQDESAAILIKQVVYYQDHDLLQYMEIFDSPGAGSRSQRHTDLAKDLLSQADAICFLTEGSTPLERSEEMDFLERAKKAGRLEDQRAGGFFVVANKIDLSQKSPDKIRLEIQRKVKEEFQGELRIPDANIHAISCKTGAGLSEIQSKLNHFLNYDRDRIFLERCWEAVDESLKKLSREIEIQIKNLEQDIAEHEWRLKEFKESKNGYLIKFDEIIKINRAATDKIVDEFKVAIQQETKVAKQNDTISKSDSIYWRVAAQSGQKSLVYLLIKFDTYETPNKEQKNLIGKVMHDFTSNVLIELWRSSRVEDKLTKQIHDLYGNINNLCSQVQATRFPVQIKSDCSVTINDYNWTGFYNLAEKIGDGWNTAARLTTSLGVGVAGSIIAVTFGVTALWASPIILISTPILIKIFANRRPHEKQAHSCLEVFYKKAYSNILEEFSNRQIDLINTTIAETDRKSEYWFKNDFILKIEDSIQKALDDRRQAEASLAEVINNKLAIDREVGLVRDYHRQIKQDADKFYRQS